MVFLTSSDDFWRGSAAGSVLSTLATIFLSLLLAIVRVVVRGVSG